MSGVKRVKKAMGVFLNLLLIGCMVKLNYEICVFRKRNLTQWTDKIIGWSSYFFPPVLCENNINLMQRIGLPLPSHFFGYLSPLFNLKGSASNIILTRMKISIKAKLLNGRTNEHYNLHEKKNRIKTYKSKQNCK